MIDRLQIPQELEFRPKWWWDPIPEWFLRDLDRKLVVQIVQVQLDFQEAMLKQQVRAIGKTREILRQIG